jgi:hypothetical protein
MKRPRFLLDENIPHAIHDQLLRLSSDIDVLTIGQPGVPVKGTPDPNLLHWIERTGYILVTGNRRTIPIHLQAHFEAGGHIPGILFLRRYASLGQVIENLFLLWAISEAEELQDRVLYIPL